MSIPNKKLAERIEYIETTNKNPYTITTNEKEPTFDDVDILPFIKYVEKKYNVQLINCVVEVFLIYNLKHDDCNGIYDDFEFGPLCHGVIDKVKAEFIKFNKYLRLDLFNLEYFSLSHHISCNLSYTKTLKNGIFYEAVNIPNYIIESNQIQNYIDINTTEP
jgi:hypothetical protein